ncbi:hypothetical protein DID78_05710 [Candidatus Marinamargulisbacteria bacterium SCGC AG-343-D04]|nr:hypothetical protein DID78_05710 [Candidatus Marinamargulisbacteria bacterium SCGC AG-343-D04]
MPDRSSFLTSGVKSRVVFKNKSELPGSKDEGCPAWFRLVVAANLAYENPGIAFLCSLGSLLSNFEKVKGLMSGSPVPDPFLEQFQKKGFKSFSEENYSLFKKNSKTSGSPVADPSLKQFQNKASKS